MRYLIVVLALTLAGCGSSLDRQHQKIERFAKGNRVGSSPDVWLVKQGLAGKERLALIFGYASDFDFCTEIAGMYNSRYPDGGTYSCETAN